MVSNFIYNGTHKESCVNKNLSGFSNDFTQTILNRYKCAECENIFFWENVNE